MTTDTNFSDRRLTFPRRMRLSGSRSFERVYNSRRRRIQGPLLFHSAMNGLAYSRIGLAVPRRVGTAARRNRIKRLLREAFRLGRHAWPTGYDVVISVRPHVPLSLSEYQHIIERAFAAIQKSWTSKPTKTPPIEPPQ